MAYSSFTYSQLQEQFGIEVTTQDGLFRATPPHPPTPLLREILERQAPIARDVSTEMARSAMIVAPVLAEIREVTARQIGVFPGVELNVDRKAGLHGFCDFLLGRTAAMIDLQAPLLAVVEAKREDITAGIPQCLAAMYAAQLFNEKKKHPVAATFGVVTSGTAWRFLELRGTSAHIDSDEYYIDDLDKILGILLYTVTVDTMKP
jgi:hypothetical protein